ncbi:putative signal peptide protein [Puccinia sorghi]|uniref:Putative signal peptide protein n=1 Tax=Puccinia sorghi TaxID=27349 RepID=A0A0L6ULS8_9BASI|nr:putative signal peptide protein [Puccinia sorghi]
MEFGMVQLLAVDMQLLMSCYTSSSCWSATVQGWVVEQIDMTQHSLVTHSTHGTFMDIVHNLDLVVLNYLYLLVWRLYTVDTQASSMANGLLNLQLNWRTGLGSLRTCLGAGCMENESKLNWSLLNVNFEQLNEFLLQRAYPSQLVYFGRWLVSAWEKLYCTYSLPKRLHYKTFVHIHPKSFDCHMHTPGECIYSNSPTILPVSRYRTIVKKIQFLLQKIKNFAEVSYPPPSLFPSITLNCNPITRSPTRNITTTQGRFITFRGLVHNPVKNNQQHPKDPKLPVNTGLPPQLKPNYKIIKNLGIIPGLESPNNIIIKMMHTKLLLNKKNFTNTHFSVFFCFIC